MSAFVDRLSSRAAFEPRVDADESLLRAVVAGDRFAFGTLVRAYSALCYRVAWRQLQSREDAEEVTQELFLTLWSEPWRWRPGKAPFKAWLLRVLSNRCVDRLRARACRSAAARTLEAPAAEPAPETHWARLEEQRRLCAALRSLPADYRLAVNLYYYEELPQEEVALVLGRSRRAVESLLRRARFRLRELLEEVP